jgi:GTP-binding protein
VKIQRVEFAGSVADPKAPLPGSLPQVAFCGRSNVGKSSLINVLLQRTRSKLAHVSARPGKTQLLNFYRVNDRFFLVDLPGFGFARAPKEVREGWGQMVRGYLSRPDGPRGTVHLLDIRHDPTAGDREMLETLAELGLPVLVVLTKIDKLTRAHRTRRTQAITASLGLDPDQVVPFSSVTGEGRDELLEALEGLLEGGEESSPGVASEAVDGDGSAANSREVASAPRTPSSGGIGGDGSGGTP